MERRDASGPTDTFVIVDADVRTQSVTAPIATAVAWRDGAILAVGTREEVSLRAGPDARTWSAHGATVLPGFVDAHHHASIAALYGGTLRLAPPAVTDIASLQRALAEADATLPPDAWLVATDWDESLLAERRAPTRRELDDAVPRRPLFAMHYSCHRALANSRALSIALPSSFFGSLGLTSVAAPRPA